MNWLNSFKKNESALVNLSKKIFENSLLCAQYLEADLEKKYGKNSKEFTSKYVLVLFEFMYFFLHLTSRSAFGQLGDEKRCKLQHKLGPLVVDTTIETLFGHWPKNLRDGIEKDFYRSLNNAEMQYGSCKELFLEPWNDISTLEKIDSGKKSESMLGQLIDNISQIIEGNINTNIFFSLEMLHVVIEILKEMEIDSLVLRASKEIK